MARIPRSLLWVWRLSAWWHRWDDPYAKAPKLYAAMRAELNRRRYAAAIEQHEAIAVTQQINVQQGLVNIAGYQSALSGLGNLAGYQSALSGLGNLGAYHNMPSQFTLGNVDPRQIFFFPGSTYQSL